MLIKKVNFFAALALILCTAGSVQAQWRRNRHSQPATRSQPSVRYFTPPSNSNIVYAKPTQTFSIPNTQTGTTVVYQTQPVTTQPHTTYKPAVSGSVIPRGNSAAQHGLAGLEAEIVAQTNAQRARYGRAPLAVDPSLMSTARAHASWMASARSMQHGRYAVAENIAMGQNSASEAMNSWMNSSGHRANILGGYSSIGVAAYTSSNGMIYWCQQFR
jgi:uncharacterized protein YkwD